MLGWVYTSTSPVVCGTNHQGLVVKVPVTPVYVLATIPSNKRQTRWPQDNEAPILRRRQRRHPGLDLAVLRNWDLARILLRLHPPGPSGRDPRPCLPLSWLMVPQMAAKALINDHHTSPGPSGYIGDAAAAERGVRHHTRPRFISDSDPGWERDKAHAEQAARAAIAVCRTQAGEKEERQAGQGWQGGQQRQGQAKKQLERDNPPTPWRNTLPFFHHHHHHHRHHIDTATRASQKTDRRKARRENLPRTKATTRAPTPPAAPR
ncbi:hypothetical protein GGTG_06673 [Gaeumannomyces tritici R3-111a-1]|uniref:Uncharacterized protein n=1 Tax=Gaeumannomyces tritici (strain R3-111a-1) TaxID=644352 RepID=J3NZH5_GAET3|nr:hypothetical protein GGTG_06673 [Gaeumannomyces tritici R3-111a-1]EJT76758.1 hypothetical protein GGTG_06673 [Gaeumannomyces tritici R3-111a-1]